MVVGLLCAAYKPQLTKTANEKMGKFTNINISIEREQLQKLDELRQKTGKTRSRAIQELVKEHIENDGMTLEACFKKFFYDPEWRKNHAKRA